MNQSSILLGFQDDSSIWIIVGVVLVLLFLVVAIVVIGLVIFFVMRKRKKAQAAAAVPELQMSSEAAPEPVLYSEVEPAAMPEAIPAYDVAAPAEAPIPLEEISADVAEAAPAAAAPASGAMDFDPSRTVAITRENTVTISYGYITFVSGVLAGERFQVEPEGTYIGRESSLSQIVVSDPRISKRHLWIGVKDGRVKIVDQDSRNGTFLNDPKSERITEAALSNGDTVILGESDVARFEYQT